MVSAYTANDIIPEAVHQNPIHPAKTPKPISVVLARANLHKRVVEATKQLDSI